MLKHISDDIPVLESGEEGYYEVYQDAQGKTIKKVWIENKINNKKNKEMSLAELYEQTKENRKTESRFIVLEDGESFEGEFVGVEETTGKFGKQFTYSFLVDGEEKRLNSKSFRLMENMVKAGVEEGNKTKITKTGQRFETNWKVEKIS